MSCEDCTNMFRLLFWAFVVHIVLLASVFDIHFRSPIVKNIEPVLNNVAPPANRLVLFVGDGIRADKFFSLKYGNSSAPFLRSVIETAGMWGISNAHVPTESRPGHVAIIAGMYEDPSAIFKGWQNYIVDFDSILNRSTASFSWGSPDILNIFSKGSKNPNSYFYSYSSEEQEFSGRSNSAEKLTYWVADQFEDFLKNLEWNDRLNRTIHNKGTVFFFHFLGTDIAGHTSKPDSQDYINNIVAVDNCVQRIHRAINTFFKDEKTAYIFTSDHGMTDWGSHGDGTDAETLTPFVTWGSGLGFPKFKSSEDFFKTYRSSPRDWHLSAYQKFTIQQADITPLMSLLVGIPIPVNSIGILPIDFFRGGVDWILNALILNVKQLKAQFEVRREMISSKILQSFYKPFPEPNNDNFLTTAAIEFTVSERILFAQKSCDEYVQGINYYKNYFSRFLLSLLSFMFIGWMLKLCVEIVKRSKVGSVIFSFNFHYLNRIDRWDDDVTTIACIVSVTVLVLLFVQDLTINFYIYTYLTIVIWWSVIPNLKQMFSAFPLVDIHRGQTVLLSALFLIGLEFLVLSFKWRSFVCSMVVGLNFFWAFEENKTANFHRSFMLWFVSTLIVAMFPLLPTVGAYRNIFMVIQSGTIWFLLRLLTICLSPQERTSSSFLQLFLTILSTCNTLIVDVTFSHKKGLFLSNQIMSWAILIISLITLKCGPQYLHNKFIYISHGLSTPFILMTSGHEALFLCFLFGHLYIWVSLEYYRFKEFKEESREHIMWGPKSLSFSDFRIAFFFLTYVLLGFFGLGNIASLNSFDPSWVRSYITMFSPFTMMTLIIFKTIIPIFLVVCALRVIISICQESLDIIFCIVLLFCDVIGLHFFLAVTNEGSWLQIGTSLSQFILIEVLTLLLLVLYAVALYLMPQKSRKIYGFYLVELEGVKGLNVF